MRPRTLRRGFPILAAAALLMGCGDQDGEAQSADPAPDTTNAQQAPEEVVDLSQLGFDEGDMETAAIGIAEFSDFGCIYCAQFHMESYPVLHEEFVATGDVIWKYVPITIGGFPNGDLAGRAGMCAGDLGVFAQMRDHIFENREAWLAAEPAEARELFDGYAAGFDLDDEAFAECVDSEETAQRLETNNEMSVQAGVDGTPSFVVQGQIVRGAPPLENFREALDQLITQTRAAPPPQTPAPAPGPGGAP